MGNMSGLKKMRLIGDLLKSATDGQKNSLSLEEIHLKAEESGIQMTESEIDSILAYLILNDQQIQSINDRFFHQKLMHRTPLDRSYHFHE